MKTFTRDQFEEVATAIITSIDNSVELTQRQFDVVLVTVADTLTKSLLAQGYQLPWVKQRKN